MTTVILAPHIDDEIIGCWSVMNEPLLQVIYFYEVDATRRAEAENAGRALGFTPHFVLPPKIVNEMLDKATKVYVPSRWDHHEHHRQINQAYREKATHFYSVDMVNARTLPQQEMKAKYSALSTYYRSQQSLWTYDAKYYLFESIHPYDYDVYRTLTFELLTVTVLEEFAGDVENWVRFNFDKRDHHKAFNQILSIAVRGEVTMQVDSYTYKARQTS